MNYIGISCGFHDAAVSAIDEKGKILFAGHSERYSKDKHDKHLCTDLIKDALKYVPGKYQVHYYEKPFLKAIRQLRAGQSPGPFSVENNIGSTPLKLLKNKVGKVQTHPHHLAHAAAGFQTSPFRKATVVVIDAIGELDTISIWDATYDQQGKAHYKKLWGKKYPDSIGLMYSAMTKRVGLKPLDEEYILMGMAAYGNDLYSDMLEEELLHDPDNLNFKLNLHTGVHDDFLSADANYMDIATSTQAFTEKLIKTVMQKAKDLGSSKHLVYSGGVALNCLANRLLGLYFDDVWIMPNPGDAGNSLGAAALGYGNRLIWEDAFLGYKIHGEYPVEPVIQELHENKIAGVANGRAEFGPRALGNRSLLADPRGPEIKDKVNEIKRRQKFRPFAPVILEEYVNDYFDMPHHWKNSRYMQVIAHCKHPEKFPAITHADGSSRVQTVPKDDTGIRRLLEQWHRETGCPMLLNTSLNIRGEPMVNNVEDAERFEKLYGIKVFS